MKLLNRIRFSIVLAVVPVLCVAQSNYLIVPDTRAEVTVPNDHNKKFQVQFKLGSSIGFSNTKYYTLIGLKGWQDDSGGPGHELAFGYNSSLYYRSGTNASGWENWRRVLIENSSGNVGIGTDTPTEKLSVNGKIRAQEIKVETSNWPDYVFSSDYKLTPLSEIEEFINVYRHLPGVPPAKVVESEGLSLGEMNKILLKKIEELTLHILSQEKRIRILECK
ncbi:hypothetical protein [Sphingobacterium hotanense]|uniref:hypothetical protein n=1 Tax=Sphingobacterium hotanense TaxID=649196 RepID=UPI0021A882C0|nr:hypothetical protein [Sphingobacterium hotanense]MCT1526459.1 hypothetical protein [Sphingobacterium hotanense]